MATSHLSIAEERETYLRDDGTTFTREDVFVKLSVTFRDNMLRKLKGAKLSVLLCIALHCNRNMAAWPSLALIAQETGYSEQSVRSAIQGLAEMRLVEISAQFNESGAQTSNNYRINGYLSMTNGLQGSTNNTPPGDSSYTPQGYRKYNPKKIPYEEELYSDHSANAECADAHDTPAPPPVEKKRCSKASDPRSKTPAIQCVRGIMNNRYPPIELYDEIIAILGEIPDGERLAECRREWVGRGYNANGWGWLRQWYKEGVPKMQAWKKPQEPEQVGGMRRWG